MGRRAAVLVSVLLVGAPLLVSATDLPPGDPVCDGEMPAYTRSLLRSASGKKLALDPPGDGALLYLGARHTSDPADRQLGVFEREMRGFRPTLVLYEGESRAVGTDRRDTVKRYGEAGLLRYLARELGAPARSFDVGAEDTIGFLVSRFEAPPCCARSGCCASARGSPRAKRARSPVGSSAVSSCPDCPESS